MEEGPPLNRPDLSVAEEAAKGHVAVPRREGPTIVIRLPVEMLASPETGEQ